MNDIDVTERAKLWSTALAVIAFIGGTGCLERPTSAAPQPVYDARTRQLVRLDWDADANGRIDQRTYFSAGTAVRTEVDSDDDGRVDRWEYVDATAVVRRVGSSTANDGIEDVWTYPPADGGEVRIDRAQYRDGVIDRREFLVRDALVRAEEDTNRDGLPDKWETWVDGALTVAAYDTTFSTGRADRRLVYDASGSAVLEADVGGTGRFERLASNHLEPGDTHP
jgi:hypothetical protein